MRISVCTLVDSHSEQFARLVLSLRRSNRPPAELVIGVEPGVRHHIPQASFPVRHVHAPDGGLSLATRLNRAATRANGDLLVFLDADCIAHPQLLDDYAAAAHEGGVLKGNIDYRSASAAAEMHDADRVRATASCTAIGSGQAGIDGSPANDPRRCKSLNFAMSEADFARIGGFDEGGPCSSFTDINPLLASTGLPIHRLPAATAYRDYLPQPLLALHRLDHVLAEAAKEGESYEDQASGHWLRAFALMGLVEWNEKGWRKLRARDVRKLAPAYQVDRQLDTRSALLIAELDRLMEKRADPLRPAA